MLFGDMHVSGETADGPVKVIKQHTTLFKPQPSEVRDEKRGNRGKKVRWKPAFKEFTV